MLLIGSKAWELNGGASLGREATDLDILCTQDEFYDLLNAFVYHTYTIHSVSVKGEHAVVRVQDTDDKSSKIIIVEASFIDVPGALTESNKQLVQSLRFEGHRDIPIIGYIKVAPLSLLYALKQTHKFKYSLHFEKTRKDLLVMREQLKEEVVPEWIKDWQAERQKATAKQAPILKQNKSSFFTDNVDYLYDHDTIHAAVKHLDKPAYCYYMHEGEEVLSSKEKFFAQTETVRLLGVLEESYVLALERAVIPHGTDPRRAFNTALMKVCTTITSGFFRDYAWEKYDEIQDLYNENYINKFYTALNEGRIEYHNRH